MNEDKILSGILRRFIADEENYTGTNGHWTDADLTLDGHVALTAQEGEVVFRLAHGEVSSDSPRWCATCESYGDHHTDRHGA